jgi:hypothetical protein
MANNHSWRSRYTCPLCELTGTCQVEMLTEIALMKSRDHRNGKRYVEEVIDAWNQVEVAAHEHVMMATGGHVGPRVNESITDKHKVIKEVVRLSDKPNET